MFTKQLQVNDKVYKICLQSPRNLESAYQKQKVAGPSVTVQNTPRENIPWYVLATAKRNSCRFIHIYVDTLST